MLEKGKSLNGKENIIKLLQDQLEGQETISLSK